jgi:hypothetical protein
MFQRFYIEKLTVGDYLISDGEAQVRVTAIIGGLDGGIFRPFILNDVKISDKKRFAHIEIDRDKEHTVRITGSGTCF